MPWMCIALLMASACSRTGLSALSASSGVAGSDDPGGMLHTDPRCGPDSDRVYVLSSADEMFIFDPEAVDLRLLGQVACGVALNSMSVSRDSVAHVSTLDGGLFRVALDTLECTPTPFDPAQLIGERFGMGYVAAEGEPTESLYIAELSGFATGQSVRLSMIEMPSFELRPVAPFDPPIGAMELTGTGDGRLYGYVAVEPPRLVRIDPVSAETTELTTLPPTDGLTAFDFAFWGGDFYFFASSSTEPSSDVVRFRLATGELTALGRVDARIIGAGVSTCADPGA